MSNGLVVSSPYRILFADDTPENYMMVEFFLQSFIAKRNLPVSIDGHSDGSTLIERFGILKGAVHLIITDYNMPGLTGLDVASQVRGEVPVYVMSDSPITREGRSLEELSKAHDSRFVQKPQQFEKYQEVIDGIVARHFPPNMPYRR